MGGRNLHALFLDQKVRSRNSRRPAVTNSSNFRSMLLLFLFLFLNLIPTQAGSATNAATAKSQWEAADAQLNAAYARALKVDPGELREKQRDWIAYRDFYAKDQPRQNGEGDVPFEKSTAYWESMRDLTITRIAFLKAWVGTKARTGPGWTGQYEDFFGGTLRIWKTKDGVKFDIDVVRGPTFHTGNIDGIAGIQGEMAVFRSEDSPPAVITLKRDSRGRIVVTEENTDAYHGARAYFQGLYFKTRSQPDGRQ